MKSKISIRTICVFLLVVFATGFAESVDEYDKKIDQGTQRLKELERQLNSLRSEVTKYQQQEKGLLQELDNTQRRISLTNEKIRLQNRELELRRAKKKQLQKDYQGAQRKSEELIERYKKRVVHAYKLKPDRQLDLFIDAASPRELYYRIKYVSAVNEADRELYQEIVDNIRLIDTRSAQIDRETKAIAKNVRELEEEQENLSALRTKTRSQYDKISKDKALLSEQIKDKENSIKEIKNVIDKTQKDKKEYKYFCRF